jgi:RNA polymerase sigma factor (sigma-70 family)
MPPSISSNVAAAPDPGPSPSFSIARPSVAAASPLARWFADEVQPHDASLKAYLRGAFPAMRDVDDVVQESYLRVWRARLAGSVKSARGFLFCAARNLALDFLRRNRRSPLVALGDSAQWDVIDERPDAFEQAATEEKTALLARAFAALPPRQRQIVILCKLQSKSHREVATALGLSEKTVTEHVYRGVQRLGVELQRCGVHGFRE